MIVTVSGGIVQGDLSPFAGGQIRSYGGEVEMR